MVWKFSQSLIRAEADDRSSRPKETNDMQIDLLNVIDTSPCIFSNVRQSTLQQWLPAMSGTRKAVNGFPNSASAIPNKDLKHTSHWYTSPTNVSVVAKNVNFEHGRNVLWIIQSLHKAWRLQITTLTTPTHIRRSIIPSH